MLSHPSVTPEVKKQYDEDGVVILRGLLSPDYVHLLQLGIDRNLKYPGPQAFAHHAKEDGSSDFITLNQDYFAIPEYQRLHEDSPIADAAGALMESDEVWLYNDSVIYKKGPSEPTPFHQDTPQCLFANGPHCIAFWVSPHDVSKEGALQFVKGSHKGPTFDQKTYPGMEEMLSGNEEILAGLQQGEGAIPDYANERDKFEFLSWETQAGDVLMFSPNIVHGWAVVAEGETRTSVANRLIGSDAVFGGKPGLEQPRFPGVADSLTVGEPLRHPCFPKLR